MRLFDEMEKTFPYLEKVYRTLIEESHELLNYKAVYETAADTVVFVAMEKFLAEGSLLHTLFLQAEILEKRAMGYHLFKWMLINMRFNEREISRADTAPVQE